MGAVDVAESKIAQSQPARAINGIGSILSGQLNFVLKTIASEGTSLNTGA
jgi:hypothetical protein